MLAEVHYRHNGGEENASDELLDELGALQSGRRTEAEGRATMCA
jgi:hypothetical protein